jgi:hypothetical protein
VTGPGNIDLIVPWSEMELADLEHGLRLGVSLEVIADFIKRDVDEVRQKADELGILPSWKRLPGKVLGSEARQIPHRNSEVPPKLQQKV